MPAESADRGRFSYVHAETMQQAFRAAADALEQTKYDRVTHASEAKADFKGLFAEKFQRNTTTAYTDAHELERALRKVAEYLGTFIRSAHEEDARRETANEWVREYKSRNGWEKFWDDRFGVDDMPDMEPGKAPQFAAFTPLIGYREALQGSSAAGGTSSARPDNLRSFASGSRALDAGLVADVSRLKGNLASFKGLCSWAILEADGVINAYNQYLEANENDAHWAVVVADAFAAAGANGGVSTVSDAALAAALAAAGVNADRQGLSIDPPRASGALPTTGYANDPVNTATGNFIEPETDLGFAGMASGLTLTRMYNSLPSGLEVPGAFGPGWASVLDQHLVLSDEGCRWVLADGRAVDFPRAGEGWDRAVGENYWLTREPAASDCFSELATLPTDGTDVLVVRDNQGAWWAYTPAGVWLGAGAGPGRAISVHRENPEDRNIAGQVTRLSHALGRFLEIDYVFGRAAVVRASDGRRAEYGYDDAGRLVSVTTETGTRTYRWNDAGLIDAVYSAAGVLEAENTYDEQGRVILQLTQHGRRTRFAYLPGRVTAVSDEDGTRSNSWIADPKGRLVGVLDSHDQRQSMAYDRHGNLVSLTERDGSVTVHAYDQRGRRIRTVTPEGADLTYGWDEQDRITTLVTETGSVVTYDYADDLSRDPAAINDPLGGRTELLWQDGLLVRITDPAGVSVSVEYNEYGDLIATRNALGGTTRILRDSAGRPTAAVTPSGARTRFTYNAAGLLERRVDPDGAVWSFAYDPAGRVAAVIAPDGGRTELQYASNGEMVRSTDPLGRSTERVFDELGNVAEAILPDGARWGYTHDTLSRLTRITDPAGNDWAREYDKIGNLTAVVDPTGVRAEAAIDRKSGTATLADAFSSATYSFDEYGRPVRAEAVDGSAELTTYDAAGNPVELIDGEGGLTVLGRDVAGKITSVTSPSGAVTRYEYDACGRPWKTVDPLGAVTELAYDADQRVVARTLPTGEVERFDYDACGRLILSVTPGNGTARYGYDRVGRLIFSQDPWYGTRRFKYNTAGELIETTNGVGGRTRFEYDVRGRLTRITDPLGGVITRTYTEIDKVSSVTDPLGRVTTATYDPAGRQVSQTDPDGNTTTWTYDAAGRETTTSHNGTLLGSISRDALNRRVVISDGTGTDGLAVEHEFEWNRRGQLISRTRGGQGMSWSYDADGNRTGFTDTTGTTTRYTRDAAGRVTGVSNSRLGDASFTHDRSGRLTAATAGELVQEWVYRNGHLFEHTRADRTAPGTADTTLIGRDDDGRITGLTRAGAVTRYSYDGAGQLIAAATTDRSGTSSDSQWEYDAGGRLVRESTSAGLRVYEYDDAGQLTAVVEADGARTEYVHDGLGRRVRSIGPDGSWVEYAWGATGYLQATAEHAPDGTVRSQHRMWTDVLGELASVDGCPVWWDTAKPVPTLAGLGTEQVLSLPGGVTGFGDAWISPNWRAARPTGQTDPWAVLGASAIPEAGFSIEGSAAAAMSGGDRATGLTGVLPAGISLTGNGGLDIAGLEWLGRRAFDPATRGFLSTDPLAPVLGAGWDGNPYAYAGNNPLNATDPTGLQPLTDAQLQEFTNAHQGDWETILGVGMIVAGTILACSGVGSGLGMILLAGALSGGGWSLVGQKSADPNKPIDWGKFAVDSTIGAVSGLAGWGAGKALTQAIPRATQLASSAGQAGYKATESVIKAAVTPVGQEAIKSGVSGATSNFFDYTTDQDNKDKSVTGAFHAATTGFATNVGFSAVSSKLTEHIPSLMPMPYAGQHAAPTVPIRVRVAEELVDRTVGVGGSLANEALRPEGQFRNEDDKFDLTNVGMTGLQGLASGT
ncbi:DUF6531 domain-containing protein [Arthrobacter yangruifuii]|uniref:DUF6531 domain-containing protein n=1 Tax=Arthrobacter yangruifuii TaxID=2606616 RepID=UPI001884CE63|nr:DUF6531 domain-containing protein [Arthrobacter yangruifuii]